MRITQQYNMYMIAGAPIIYLEIYFNPNDNLCSKTGFIFVQMNCLPFVCRLFRVKPLPQVMLTLIIAFCLQFWHTPNDDMISNSSIISADAQ